MTVNDIYLFLEQIAPFKNQESYDNSGFLIGEQNAIVTQICICLDITVDVVNEAKEKGANLIISHHPVIFKPISGIKANSPVYELIKNEINVISAHTNFDAVVMADLMLELLEFPNCSNIGEVIETVGNDGAGMGKMVQVSIPITPTNLARMCKKAFNSPSVRYVPHYGSIYNIGVCPGSGGRIIDLAAEKRCDALITGEVKHSDMLKAYNMGMTLVEAGHYYTEIAFCEFLKRRLYDQYPQIPVFVAGNSEDVCKYL
jgi:dinuclear metal center YbgI/SA1388 family protein